MQNVHNAFPIDPELRPLPLWAWNGKITEKRIAQTLRDFHRLGFGGAFIHPRPGLISEYLSNDWFELWRFAQRTARILGLQVHLYDENSFPSGFAGGHVTAARPDMRLSRIVCGEANTKTVDGKLAEFEYQSRPVSILYEPTEVSGWYAGGTYVDLMHVDAAATFADLTHSRYGREVDTAGLLSFTDEPSVMDYSRGALPWSEAIEESFYNENSYKLRPQLPHIFADIDQSSPAVRYDFQATLMRLFQRNWIDKIEGVCAANGMKLTGHLHEHEWPCPRYQANTMFALSGFDIPGIDLLGFQINLADRANHGRWLLTMLEATSVAAQLGKKIVLCEAYGGGGYETTLRDLKRQGDYLLAGAINLLVPHMSYQTMTGARKFDWPQTISDHAPFWEDMEPLHIHQTRVASLLSQGQSAADILVLHPTASGWLYWTPDSATVGRDTELPLATAHQREAHSQFLRTLADSYFDFHLGDEWLLESKSELKNNSLHVGSHQYSCVVISPQMETIRRETLDILKAFAEVGGKVYVFGEGPGRLEGRLSSVPKGQLLEIAIALDSVDQLPTGNLILRGHGGKAVTPGLQAIRRITDGKSLYFLANPWDETLEAELEFESIGLFEIDTVEGTTTTVSSLQQISLGPGEHRLWMETDEVPQMQKYSVSGLDFRLIGVKRLEPNILPIDRCSLETYGKEYDEAGTIIQNRNLWRSNGFEGDPWEWGVQFKRELVDRVLPLASGFAANWQFDSNIEGLIQLGVERPWLYEIQLNGAPVEFESVSFFDEEIRLSMPVRATLGTNTISLCAEKLDIHHEIAPVWVLGDFEVNNSILNSPKSLAFGCWGEHGLPNYPWTIEYQGRFLCDFPGEVQLTLDADGYSSSEILLNGKKVALDWGNGGWISIGPVSNGEHELCVRVRGNLRNLLGPFGVEGLPGPWLWYEAAELKSLPYDQVKVNVEAIRLRILNH